MAAIFGPAGRGDSFTALGYRKSSDLPAYLQRFGLTAFEYQCGHGLRVNRTELEHLGALAKEAGIAMSLHTPYYISLSSVEPEKRKKSVEYIVESAELCRLLGGNRIVVHTGSCGKMTREEALALAADTLKKAQQVLDDRGLSEIHICPETMGKINQLGTLEEVLSLCTLEERWIPCIDFGHLNARTFGGIQSGEDYRLILEKIGQTLGEERLKHFHSHFSKIEYTQNGGEKQHLTFADTVFGPDFKPLAEWLVKKNLSPTMICESAGTQAEDAAAMQELYRTAGQEA